MNDSLVITYSHSIRSLQDSIYVLHNKISSIENALVLSSKASDNCMQLMSVANGSIANQISALGFMVGAISIIFVVISAFANSKLNKSQKKFEQLRELSSEAENKARQFADEARQLSEDIRNNKQKIFKELIEYEIDHSISMIKREPRNVFNLRDRLCALSISEIQAYNLIEIAKAELTKPNSDIMIVDDLIAIVMSSNQLVTVSSEFAREYFIDNLERFWDRIFDHEMMAFCESLEMLSKTSESALNAKNRLIILIINKDAKFDFCLPVLFGYDVAKFINSSKSDGELTLTQERRDQILQAFTPKG